MISAHYGLSDVFDNLIISLCKFTALSSEVSWSRNCVWSSKGGQASHGGCIHHVCPLEQTYVIAIFQVLE